MSGPARITDRTTAEREIGSLYGWPEGWPPMRWATDEQVIEVARSQLAWENTYGGRAHGCWTPDEL